ncbi:hypothetical protein [Microvirga aerophila]|uniref:Uncharacterized protein n=1 Tax=Microvirga aerophila TaxID=670291 RepID=A0A512C527_9HYPH|nr:hypothetical protein [Microvirga aerophila]GEO19301.1 hypothetical protein MAE02_69970 [Microvirga aerophila]
MPTVRNKRGGTRSSLHFEPPTLDEAIFAAQGLADDVRGQMEIAAMLVGLPENEVRAAVLKAVRPARGPSRPSPSPCSASGPQVVVVERRAPRTIMR